jgi:hypothetical protein
MNRPVLVRVSLLGSLLAVAIATAAFGSTAMAASVHGAAKHYVGKIVPATTYNQLDCNGWSPKYEPTRDTMRELCTDPIHINAQGKASRLIDNGWYVGHDEPSVKFISSTPGSGNSMTYYMQLPVDPGCTPDAAATCTKYGELSVAPWFGLPMCDAKSYPQNPCTPDSDSNSGGISDPNAAGSAFMELQFYPPGFTPFEDNTSCSTTKWCAALTIDSLECTYGFAACNPNCEEPVNFAFLQQNGVPTGPASPQLANVETFTPNADTLELNPGDVLQVSISDPASGFLTSVTDLTTGQSGFIQASAANGFTDTNIADCSGNPYTWHAEYSTAKQQNQVPWAALEGGVLMEQEIGHGESCDSISNSDPFSVSYPGGNTFSDPNVQQTCNGGLEGSGATGEGPCNSAGTVCSNATTQGPTGPTACPTNDSASGFLCEFSDGYCFPAGSRPVTFNGVPSTASEPLNFCTQSRYQNGDLDFEGNSYIPDWPDGGSNHPTTIRYSGPYTSGQKYPQIQFETDVGGSSNLCNTATGAGCTAPPISAAFYPFWSLNNKQTMPGDVSNSGSCMWNFGNDISGITTDDFGKDAQYGTPDVARYGGTIISGVTTNPETASECTAPANVTPPTISGDTTAGQTLTENHGTWTNNPTSFSYQWFDCDSSGANCAAISGATGQSYTLTSADVGHTIEVQETATNANGSGTAKSAPTAVVAAFNVTTGPTSNRAPTISGRPRVGATLSSSTGLWSGAAPLSYSYHWQRCKPGCSNISGATGSTYKVRKADFRARIDVVVTASNTYGSASSTSSQVGPIGPSVAQIKALLSRLLKPHGKGASIRRLIGKGGYPFVFKSPSPGQLVIRWFRGRQLIASVTVNFGRAGKVKSEVLLSYSGGQILRNLGSADLRAMGTFTPARLPGTTINKRFTLKR